MQRRHTTAAGRKEAEAKKRKEGDEKMAQADGKGQGAGEGSTEIGVKEVKDYPYGICCPWVRAEDGTWMLWENNSIAIAIAVVLA